MSARETIARAIEPFVHHADDVTSVVANTLTAAGYRILGPGELDVETVEQCAEVVEKTHYMHSSHQYYRSAAINIAAAIRALEKQEQGR